MIDIYKILDDEIFVAALIAGLYATRGNLLRLSRDNHNFFYDLAPSISELR